MSAQPPPVMQDEDATRQRLRSALGDLVSQWPQLATAEQKVESDQNRAELLHLFMGEPLLSDYVRQERDGR